VLYDWAKPLVLMAKRQTTVRIDPDLDEPLEEFMKTSKVNLTELFNMFLRQILGIEKAPNLIERVENLEQKAESIDIRVEKLEKVVDEWINQ